MTTTRTAATRTAALEAAIKTLEEAEADVAAAEGQLEAVLAEIKTAPRAEKTNVSRPIELALDRLRAARAKVAAAEATIASETRSV
jgi:hypothetical protein